MKKFFQNKSFGFRIAVLLILLYVLIALVAPFIANNKPLVCSTDKGFIFPMFENKTDIPKGNCIYALIPYGPNETNLSSGVSLSPLDPQKDLSPRYRHWLGTDKLGRDVAAGIIHGTKVAIQIGFISVIFSFIFGVSLGLLSGYYKDENIKFNIFQVVLSSVFFVLWMFYMVFEWQFGHLNLITIVMWFCIFLLCQYAIIVFALKIPTKIKYHFPLDTLVVKSIELRKSFPGIFILLALTTLFATPSVWNIILIITLLGWTEFARYARAETLAVKQENYINTAKILGFSHIRILLIHILPNIMPTLIVVACFSVSGAILLESTLSFLGIGLPVEQVSWGKMMAEGRSLLHWWMVVFPGIALFIIILCLITIADSLQDKRIG